MKNSVWIGFDPREAAEFAVARQSVERHSLKHWPICGLVLSKLRAAGLYTRPMEIKQGVDGPEMWDVISGARQATEHANSRFLVPHLAEEGWALFMDGDTMVRSSLMPLFASLDYGKALYCVHHKHEPTTQTKMDGQVQQNYGRKNWSSMMIFNCDHPANKKLTVEMVNTLPGRDLHRFCWLEDRHIGELDQSWNVLVGHTDPDVVPDLIHWTSGTPAMKGYENVAYADEWRKARDNWAQGSLSLPG
jgi:hypothetical protein